MNPPTPPHVHILSVPSSPKHNNAPHSPQQHKNTNLLIPNMDDSHSTAHSSYLFGSKDPRNNKLHSFKRIKESKIRQKQQVGGILHRRVISSRSLKKNGRIETLDDVKTISSHLSPKSQVSVSRCLIEESIIIMRGNGMNQLISEDPPTPFFRKTKSVKDLKRSSNQFLKFIPDQQLLYCVEAGLLCHYQVFEGNIERQGIKLGDNNKHTNILECYGGFGLEVGDREYTLGLFQPYTERLDEFFDRKEQIEIKKIVYYLIQIMKVLCHLRISSIYPLISRQTIFFSNGTIKMRIIPGIQMDSERKMIEQTGKFFLELILSLEKQSLVQSTRYVTKIKGMTLHNKIYLIDLFNQFIFNDDFTLQEGYIKLQAFDC